MEFACLREVGRAAQPILVEKPQAADRRGVILLGRAFDHIESTALFSVFYGEGRDAYVHFEVRRGFDSVNPMPYLQ